MKITISAAVFALMAVGCASGSHYHRAHFAEYGPDGRATYYRLTVRWEGTNGQTDFRSGWYASAAVDDLYGDVSIRDDAATARKRRLKDAIAETFSRYMDALEVSPTDPAILEQRRAAYLEALQAVRGMTELGDSPDSAADRLNKKFLLVLSHDPDQIIKAIRGRIQQQRLTESMRGLFDGRKEEEARVMETELRLLEGELKALEASLDAKKSNNTITLTGPQIQSLIDEMEAGK